MSSVPRPKYLELSGDLKNRIAAGEFRSGEQIPSELELVSCYRVSRNTVRQALALLEEENYLVRRRGAGTFVQAIDATGKPKRKLDSVLLLIVGSEDVPSYNMRRFAAVEQWAARRQISVAAANLLTEDLIKGRRPTILEQDVWQAIFFDGWVTDLHCLVAEERGLPYLVVGNHPVSSRRPQVRLDIETMMDRMIAYLQTQAGVQPIVLIQEPLALHVSKEILLAYTEHIRRLPQQLPWVELVKDHQVSEGVGRLLENVDKPFSLIATGRQLPAIVEIYRRYQIDLENYPIVSLAHTHELNELDATGCALMPFDGDSIMVQALSEFASAYEQGEAEELYLSLCPRTIVPSRAWV